MKYLVTVKLPRNPEHDPKNKVTGYCPVASDVWCTDVTGEHHTVLVDSMDDVAQLSDRHHITRTEEVSSL